MPIRTSAQYLDSLRDGRQIIYQGRTIQDVTSEPGFQNTTHAIAQFYDFQNLPHMRDIMTYQTSDGDTAGMAFIEPHSKDDLRRRAAAYSAWADVTCGLMGRSPDYMNSLMMTLGSSKHLLSLKNKVMGSRAYNLYLDSRRRDLCFTHTFIPPFVDRFKPLSQQPGTLRIIKETPDGPIISGARAIATLAPFSNSNLSIHPSPGSVFQKGEEAFAISFTVDVNSPGVRWICRDTFDLQLSHFNAPLSSKSDEMDCMAVFDHCLIPWNKVFIYKDVDLYNKQGEIFRFTAAAAQQVLARSIAKTRFLFGLAHLLAESSQISNFVNVQERLGDFALYLQNLESLAITMVEAAVEDPISGIWYPNPTASWVSLRLFPEYYPKMINHLLQLGASGYVSSPQEKTLESLGLAIENYFRSSSSSAHDKVALFRLAWDLVGSSWGNRQELYERFFFGDTQRWKVLSYLTYNKSQAINMVKRMLSLPDSTFPYPFPSTKNYFS